MTSRFYTETLDDERQVRGLNERPLAREVDAQLLAPSRPKMRLHPEPDPDRKLPISVRRSAKRLDGVMARGISMSCNQRVIGPGGPDRIG